MGTYGREVIETVGSAGITLTADGAPVAKHAGVTVAWDGVPALTADYEFKHDYLAPKGSQIIRYGTMLCRITASTVATEVGKFIPYATGTATETSIALAAVNGVTRTISVAEGDVFATNEITNRDDRNSDHPVAIDGGRVYRRRLLVVGFGDGTGADNDATPPNSGQALYAGGAAQNAADLVALGIAAMPVAMFKVALPQITFVTES